MGGQSPSLFLIFLLLPTLLPSVLGSASSPLVVQAPWGTLRGFGEEGDGGRKLNVFMGIPYAVSPVGERRYEKPLPHPGPGEGEVFVADQTMPACPQQPWLIGSSRETGEDCLKLDVYMPAEEEESVPKPYAVMVFIHGGGLVVGDAYSYRPSKLVADGKVIVVVIQYRLGVLGFLSSGDGVLPENLGLWDQILALRWVKDNIPAFGGDANRITIFGESAGSWSVGLHQIMPQSKGLFKRAIMQSGAPQNLNSWMNSFNKKTIFKTVTDMVGCGEGTTQQRVQCLKRQPVDVLMNKSAELESTSPVLSYYYPVIDGELFSREARELLLDRAFVKENGLDDVDVMVGFNKNEGASVLFFEVLGLVTKEDMTSAQFFRNATVTCFLFMGLQTNNAVLNKATEFFYRGADMGLDLTGSMLPLVDMYGDCLLTIAIIEWARHLAAAGPSSRSTRGSGSLYMYVVDHDFAFNRESQCPGAHHGDELFMEFDIERMPTDSLLKVFNKTSLAEEELGVADRLVDIWTTFAKTGNPNSKLLVEDLGDAGPWPQFIADEERYLSFSGTPAVLPSMGPYKDRAALWLQFLPQLEKASQPVEAAPSQDQSSAREEL